MLVSPLPLLKKARAKKYALPAFNINNLEILKAVTEAAVEMKSPLIIQTSEGAIEYAGMNYLVAMMRVAAQSPIPVALHLDHGKHLPIIKQAIASGYTSVMFDGSLLPWKENISLTKKVVRLAHAKHVSVEAEIGVLAGVEDLASASAKEAKLTDPKDAKRFVEETGCDALAIAIGTSHGAYKFSAKGGTGKTHLDIERLKNIAKLVPNPLVLHGASGVREDVVKLAERYGAKLGEARGVLDQDIKAAIREGIAKVNIDTDLRLAFTAGIHEAVADLPRVIDPRKLLESASLLMKEVAKQKIKLFGSAGKA